MSSQTLTLSGNGTTAAILVNPLTNWNAYFPYLNTPSWSLGLILNLSVNNGMTCNVQITGAANPLAAGTVWNAHDILVGITSSTNSNIAFPVTAVRLNVTGYSSGTATLYCVQWP
jgi:hypothetical protein